MSYIPIHHRTRTRLAMVLPLLAVTAIGAAGCSTDSSDGSAASTSGGTLSSIQFVNPLPNYPAWKTTGQCMKDAATERGVKLSESGPTGSAIDATVMIQQVQQAISNKAGAIVTMQASDGFTPVLQQAQADGIVTGTFYGPGGADSGADVNAGPDWSDIAGQVIGGIADKPGQHVVGLVASGNSGLGKLWLDGIKAAAAKTDNVTIVGEVYTSDDAAKALPQVNALLTAHPDITDIATHMGTTTPGAVAAIKAQGLKGKTFLVVGGHDNGGNEAVADGYARSMLLQDVCGLGKDMVNGVIDVSEGKPAPQVPVRVAVVDAAEIKGYLDKGWV
jgi:ABC-type sugar transport system substrate-binding protein